MTLTEIRRRYPALFYEQTWFVGESFMDVEARTSLNVGAPNVLEHRGKEPPHGVALQTAADLAWLYVHTRDADIWYSYLWTRDVDRHGQRVYVGCNSGKLEIHRHIRLTDRFGVPCWT